MGISKSYEEIRQQRLEENKKRMEDLGLTKLCDGLQAAASGSKSQVTKPRKLKEEGLPLERRFSSRVSRLPTPIYREVDEIPRQRKSYGRKQSGKNQILHMVKLASYEARMQAVYNAEKIVEDLGSKHPSFIKSLVRSHVSSCFWLGLPTDFCRKYLPPKDTKMVLEDEKGEESDSVFIAARTGLSGGWRGFSLDHKLDDGDALVFELVEPTRFKVHVTKVEDFEPVTKKKIPSKNGDLQKKSSTTTTKIPSAASGSKKTVSELAAKVNNDSDHREETNTRKTKRGRIEYVA